MNLSRGPRRQWRMLTHIQTALWLILFPIMCSMMAADAKQDDPKALICIGLLLITIGITCWQSIHILCRTKAIQKRKTDIATVNPNTPQAP